MTTNAEALRQLRESRDGEPARIWHDSGRSVGRLARLAGVKVVYISVDLTAQTSELKTVDGREGGGE